MLYLEQVTRLLCIHMFTLLLNKMRERERERGRERESKKRGEKNEENVYAFGGKCMN